MERRAWRPAWEATRLEFRLSLNPRPQIRALQTRYLRILRRILHYAAYVAGGAVIVVSLVALTFKFWVMPRVSDFVPLVEARAGAALAQTVRIGRMQANWRGAQPRLILHDVRVAQPDGEALLLPEVDAVLSWWSLPLLEPRLASLSLTGLRLNVHRDAVGVIRVAGVPVNQPGDSGAFTDWLMQQHRVVVKDAEITWLDELLGAPALHVTGVRLLLENRFGRHRFGGIARPMPAAGRLELRGDLKSRAPGDWRTWSGTVYARVDAARFDHWRQWVPWAHAAVKDGAGDLRFWLDLGPGIIQSLDGDARLRRIAVSMAGDLPDLAFDRLQGRVNWSRQREAHELRVDALSFQLPGQPATEPANVRVRMTPDEQGGFRRVDGSATNLRLEALTALTGALPLPKRGHALIEALSPVGLVERAEAHWAGAADYAFRLEVRDAGLLPFENLPGFSGVSARVRADQDDGEIELQGRAMRLIWPSVFRHELDFARLDAKANWRHDHQGGALSFELARIGNDDLEGDARGRITLPKGGAPVLDIHGHLRRVEAGAVYRYLPHAVADDAYTWLRRALIAGTARDVRARVKGPVDRFPFDTGGGEFDVQMNMVDAVLDYAPGWPRIEGVQGRLRFHDKAMTLVAHAGRILDTRIGPVRAHIPDLHHSDVETLYLDGRAAGETRAFLDFIQRSPVRRHTGGFTDPLRARGDGELVIRLEMPVRHVDDTRVSGSYSFRDNDIDPGDELPDLQGVSGRISFTDTTLQARALRLRVLGMPALLDLDSRPGGQVEARLAGTATAESLRAHVPAALVPRLAGQAAWRAHIGLSASGRPAFTLTSDLAGLAVDLPSPLGKAAREVRPLWLRRDVGEDGGKQLAARYGEALALRARLPAGEPPWLSVRLGAAEAEAPRLAGLVVGGTLERLDVDAWRGVVPAAAGEPGPAGPSWLREADIHVGELRVQQRRLPETRLRVRPADHGWRIDLEGAHASGEIVTLPGAGGTRVSANFKHLRLPEPEPEGAAGAAREQVPSEDLAGLELNVASLQWKNFALGELRLRLTPEARGLRVDQMTLKTPETLLEGKGLLANHRRRPTRIDLRLDSADLGKLLTRLGYPESVRQAATRVTGHLAWMGGVEDFAFATLDGELDLQVGKGQFLKVDPGAARLLGIISLQALPRRIALDFRDVFSEGFAFDEIAGALYLQRGKAYTKDLRMNGPAARVRMSGVIDLDRETQNLRLAIQPRLDDTMALAGALLGGPAVGLGALIAGKVLQDPIGQAATFEYTLTGTWSDPVVAKAPRARQEAPPAP